MIPSPRHSRRGFLKGSAASMGAAALAGTAPAPMVWADDAPAKTPTEKLRVAVIGMGGMGAYSMDRALTEELVACADVDEKTIASVMAKKVEGHAKPKIFHDYRKMLDDCHNDIDVVLIATPDHHHAPAAIRAIDYGKHVFCQKPLAHDIAEVYTLAKAAKEKKVLTQMGNQGYCGEAMRRISEYVAAGAIGTVTETHTILDRNFGGTGGRPSSEPIPAGVHWDEWIGPAPFREYHKDLHPFNWRNWRAFGTGTIGDMACHRVAYPFMALRLWEVKNFTVECVNTTGGSDEKYPQDNVVCYHIPARPDLPACKCYVYDHKELRPPVMKELEQKYSKKWGEAGLFVGTNGYLDTKLIPEEAHKAFPPPPKTLPRAKGGGPIDDLFACIRTGGVPASNFADRAGPLSALVLTGHLAQFAGIGAKIDWDAEKMECTNKPELNRYVRREYRKGWEVV